MGLVWVCCGPLVVHTFVFGLVWCWCWSGLALGLSCSSFLVWLGLVRFVLALNRIGLGLDWLWARQLYELLGLVLVWVGLGPVTVQTFAWRGLGWLWVELGLVGVGCGPLVVHTLGFGLV